jgi:hypothetical protein
MKNLKKMSAPEMREVMVHRAMLNLPSENFND